MWLHERVETLKKKSEISVEGFINDFAANLNILENRASNEVAEDAGDNNQYQNAQLILYIW